jgi:hypothetical protein
VGLKGRIARLERKAAKEMAVIPQLEGTVKRFPERQLAEAFLNAMDRAVGLTEDEHPLSRAARNSPDPEWRNSVYVQEVPDHPVEDLSEP